MSTESFTVRALEGHDIASVAGLLASSFDYDPAYRYLFPDAETRRRGLEDFFARNLGMHARHRCTYVAIDGGALAATVTVRPLGGIRLSTLSMIRHGLAPFALTHGPGAVRRLFALIAAYDELEARAAGAAPHRFVHMMAVARDRQGRGLGTRLLDAALTETAGTDGLVVLTTHEERNVVFYQRRGFEVCDDRTITLRGAAAPYRVWSLRRPRTRGHEKADG